MLKKKPEVCCRKYKRSIGVLSISDGIVKTKGVLPVGIGKLVYFKHPKVVASLIPGIVMSSESNYSIVFTLGQNSSVTTEHIITLFYNSYVPLKKKNCKKKKISNCFKKKISKCFKKKINRSENHKSELQ